MKLKLLIISLISGLIFSCEDDDNNRDSNPCLRDKNVNFLLNLNLPLYADLQLSGNDLFLKDDVNFIKGVYIRNVGNVFFAFELAEPNDCVQECSTPDFEDAFFTYSCGDETSKYDILGNKVDRQDGEFNMRQYNASLSGNTLTISY